MWSIYSGEIITISQHIYLENEPIPLDSLQKVGLKTALKKSAFSLSSLSLSTTSLLHQVSSLLST